MPMDKSPLYYGLIFHMLLDPQLKEARQEAIAFIPEGSSVLDVACGTGKLSIALKKQKSCRVVGIDLSLRMLNFARKSNPSNDIFFLHENAADLRSFGDQSFDYATIMFLVHELPV